MTPSSRFRIVVLPRYDVIFSTSLGAKTLDENKALALAVGFKKVGTPPPLVARFPGSAQAARESDRAASAAMVTARLTDGARGTSGSPSAQQIRESDRAASAARVTAGLTDGARCTSGSPSS